MEEVLFSDINSLRIKVDLGSSSRELALHVNPRFCDKDAPVLVCNSLCDGIWDQEQRDTPNPFQPGSFKVVVRHTENQFEIKLAARQTFEFPNRHKMEIINYIRTRGDISLTSFKLN